jgi:hypothetical protein
MWEWYRIGLAAGLGVGFGLLFTGALAGTRAGAAAAVVLAAGAGFAAGLVIDNWQEEIGGAAGGLLGATGALELVRGTLRRGGTRGGTATLVGLTGLAVAALAFIPGVGFLEALAAPVVGARLRRRQGTRHAGLRILARD